MWDTVLKLSTAILSAPSWTDGTVRNLTGGNNNLNVPGALVNTLGPSISAASKSLFEEPFLLDFALGWDENSPVRTWYQKECELGSTAIEKIQFRRDRSGPWYHGYLIVFTQSKRIYRIDRRPGLQDQPDSMSFMRSRGCKALDTIAVQTQEEYQALLGNSDCIVELHFHHPMNQRLRQQDHCHSVYLLHLLSACFSVRDDEATKQYTLQRYNCYYLAWVIIMISVRLVADWDTRCLLALSCSGGVNGDNDSDDDDDGKSTWTSMTVSGKFSPREDWQQAIIEGWHAYYHELLEKQGMFGRDASWSSRRQMLRGMLDHVLKRVLQTEPITYPTLFLHPRNALRDLGRSIAGNMPSSFNSRVATLARDPHGLADNKPLNELAQEAKSYLRKLFTEDRLLDPTCLMLLPNEFTNWLKNTPPSQDTPPLSVPLRICSTRHALYRDAESKPEDRADTSSYGQVYTTIADHCFDLPVIEQEAEVYLSQASTNELAMSGPLQLEDYMRTFVKAHAGRVTSWGLARREENVDEDIIDAMHRVWEKLRKKFPRALAERWF